MRVFNALRTHLASLIAPQPLPPRQAYVRTEFVTATLRVVISGEIEPGRSQVLYRFSPATRRIVEGETVTLAIHGAELLPDGFLLPVDLTVV